MKTKYYIESYKKQSQSFLASINSINNTTGGISEPYEIKLKRVMFFGLFVTYVNKIIYLPKGYNVKNELIKGRRYIV